MKMSLRLQKISFMNLIVFFALAISSIANGRQLEQDTRNEVCGSFYFYVDMISITQWFWFDIDTKKGSTQGVGYGIEACGQDSEFHCFRLKNAWLSFAAPKSLASDLKNGKTNWSHDGVRYYVQEAPMVDYVNKYSDAVYIRSDQETVEMYEFLYSPTAGLLSIIGRRKVEDTWTVQSVLKPVGAAFGCADADSASFKEATPNSVR